MQFLHPATHNIMFKRHMEMHYLDNSVTLYHVYTGFAREVACLK